MEPKTNCKNCGAALDIWSPKCEFCGTRNINLTSLDLASGEPVNFIFKLPSNIKVVDQNGADIYMTTLAIPSLDNVEIVSESMDVYGGWSKSSLIRYTTDTHLEMGLKLTSVSKSYNNKQELCQIRVGEPNVDNVYRA